MSQLSPPSGNVAPLTFTGNDAAMVAALRARHPGAAAALWDKFASSVHNTVARTLGPDAEVPDVVQETFIKALNDIKSLDDPERVGAWLTSIAVFTARACIRRRKRRRLLAVWSPAAVAPTHHVPAPDGVREALREVYGALDRMPVDERLAFALRLIDGMPLSEAAAAMRVSLATFKRKLQRAERRFLAEAAASPHLREYMQEGSRWQGKRA